MTRNHVLVVIVAMLVVAGLSVGVSAQNGKELGVGKTHTVSFSEPVRVQGQTIPAGDYAVEHVMEGQNHVMIFQRLPGKHQEFRLTCTMVPLPAKAKQGSMAYDTTSGVRVLKSIIFAGDTYEHQFGE